MHLSLSPPAPLPTKAPPAEVVLQRLSKRQIGPGTCGWINEEYSDPVTCVGPGYVCLINTVESAVGCCPPTNTQCTLPTLCLDYENPSTPANSLTMKCPLESPICQLFAYGNLGYGLFGCGDSVTTQFLYTTYTDGPLPPTLLTSAAPTIILTSPSTAFFISPTAPSTSSTASPTSSTTPSTSFTTSSISSTTSATSSTTSTTGLTPSPQSPSSPSSLSGGIIAAIAVPCALLLIAVIFLVWWFTYYRTKTTTERRTKQEIDRVYYHQTSPLTPSSLVKHNDGMSPTEDRIYDDQTATDVGTIDTSWPHGS